MNNSTKEANPGVRMQVAFVGASVFKTYTEEKVFPKDGAFIEKVMLPPSSVHGLACLLNERLKALEAYRSATRGIDKRLSAITSIYAEWSVGHLTKLMPGDTVVTEGNLRLRPTEDLGLATSLDTSWQTTMPAPAREHLATLVPDRRAMNEVTPLLREQFVTTPVATLLVVMDW